MATTRKDLRGRTLRKGEMQRSSDKRYAYSYTDPLGRRKYIYANDLVTLREKEARFTKDQMDGCYIPPFSWRFGMRSSARIPQMV